jgi:hypothetical protein
MRAALALQAAAGLRLNPISRSIRARSTVLACLSASRPVPGRSQVTHYDKVVRYRARFARGIFTEAKYGYRNC